MGHHHHTAKVLLPQAAAAVRACDVVAPAAARVISNHDGHCPLFHVQQHQLSPESVGKQRKAHQNRREKTRIRCTAAVPRDMGAVVYIKCRLFIYTIISPLSSPFRLLLVGIFLSPTRRFVACINSSSRSSRNGNDFHSVLFRSVSRSDIV